MKKFLIGIVFLFGLSSVSSFAQDITVVFEGSDPPLEFEAVTVGFSLSSELRQGNIVGLTQPEDLKITKLLGPESPALFSFAAEQHGTPKVTITVSGGEEPVVVDLEDVRITQFQTETLTVGEPQLVELISLAYREICLSYGDGNTACWAAHGPR